MYIMHILTLCKILINIVVRWKPRSFEVRLGIFQPTNKHLNKDYFVKKIECKWGH